MVAKFLNEIMNSLEDEGDHVIHFDDHMKKKLQEVYDTIPHEIHQEIIKEVESQGGSPRKMRSSSNGSLNSSFENTAGKIKKKGVAKELERLDSQEIHPNDIMVLKEFL